MKVKKYVGKNMQDTIFKVKAELGSDAIILNTRKFKEGGIFGFFAKEKVEVLAGVDNQESNQKPESNKEIQEIKSMLSNLNKNWHEDDFVRSLSEPLKKVFNLLLQEGVDRTLARSLIEKMEESDEPEEQMEILSSEMDTIIGPPAPLVVKSDKRKVVALIGPTGVGKTTTIAKIAADFVQNKEYKVGLVTSDTYRIAAVQQLKTYSDIINIPLEVVYDEDEFAKVLASKYKDFDLVLLDTPGSSWNDKVQLGRLKKLVNKNLIDETHLLLSMNSSKDNIEKVIENFSDLKPNRFLLTKIDEATSFGNILNLGYYHKQPFSYFSAGQDVPDDIEVAYQKKLLPYILGDKNE